MYDGLDLATRRAISPRARRVARQLTELSRLEASNDKPELRLIDGEALLRAVCRDYPGVMLDIQAHEPIFSDSRHLAGVLFAVLDNALAHGAPPVAIRLDLGAIVISDQGPGFPADLLARATERFVTGSAAAGRGVGLGLALAVAHARSIDACLRIANGCPTGARIEIGLPPGA